MKDQQNIYAVIDLETTGSSYRKGHRIIQIGITFLQDDQVMQEYDITVNPGHSIPPLIENLTGITNRDVQSAPYFEDIAPYVYNLIQNCIFVAHNIAFDYRFLNQAFQDAGMPELELKGMDTVELAKILYPSLESYRLSDLSQLFSLSHPGVHDAAGDAHATAELFLFLKKRAVHLPIVTLEKLCLLSKHTQKNNQDFLEMCLDRAREKREPKPAAITITNGVALRTKNISFEQTNYRSKENVFEELSRDESFFRKLGYTKRKNQMEMMAGVMDFLLNEDQYDLAIEAPTGIGKTLAYSLPAILLANPDKKVIISTSTLLLQEQLLMQSLEKIKSGLPFPFQMTSLVSKNHLLNLEKFSTLDFEFLSDTEALVVMSIYVWLTETDTGDLSELSPSHQVGGLLEKIRYHQEEVRTSKKWKEEDFYVYSQLKAKQASILVTNHAYLSHHIEDFNDFGSKENPILIIDEAHRLPTVFQEKEKIIFSLSSLNRKSLKISEDTRSYREYLEKNAMQSFPQYELINLEFALEQFHNELTELEQLFYTEIIHVQEQNNKSKQKENKVYIDSEQFISLKIERTLNRIARSMKEVEMAGSRYTDLEQGSEGPSFHNRMRLYLQSLQKLSETLRQLKEVAESDYYYLQYQIENSTFACELVKASFNPGEKLQQQFRENFQKVLYISATLLLESDVDYFSRKIGVSHLPSLVFQSQIVKDQAELVIMVPSNLAPVPQINQQEWIRLVSDFICDLTEETNKKSLILFNSHEVLEKVYLYLKEKRHFENTGTEMLAQGFSGSRRRVHKRFLEAEQAVLFGTGSYWEGIDFPNHPVELLVVTRLPFLSPGTPTNLAMKKYYENTGRSAFQQEYLPLMMTRFIQGIGRVARSEKEKGIVICLDSRLVHSSYARQVQKMLPTHVQVKELPLPEIPEEAKKYFEK
ncbi:DEAD/DEAH box helicase [Jeotgalibaca sp. MA1X17-3]|uniref:helicase C-terminal domain-containing protein n=1 Tax=Jeotgalibaca sp. MA1X17-3 TaxID=2908211 RepID=UPI001F4477A5|nr:helicase C-terminal domain-containing protein [Jeotgalibaca sp. MA1X17-3]UJF14822.1 DEAD/DEAH box helicase [Jeotgalibaca sp. MA1X17-3]